MLIVFPFFLHLHFLLGIILFLILTSVYSIHLILCSSFYIFSLDLSSTSLILSSTVSKLLLYPFVELIILVENFSVLEFLFGSFSNLVIFRILQSSFKVFNLSPHPPP